MKVYGKEDHINPNDPRTVKFTMEDSSESVKCIPTVNVIVMCSGHYVEMSIEGIVSFPDTEEGNKAAEKVFLDKCASYLSNWDEHDQDDIDAYLMDGYVRFGTGMIMLVHSTNPDEI